MGKNQDKQKSSNMVTGTENSKNSSQNNSKDNGKDKARKKS